MESSAEAIKQRIGDPFKVLAAIERAAKDGVEALSDDDVFLCKWYGLYTHRHEPGYFMLRTKQPGGAVTVEQAKLVAKIADEQNKGYVDITTRQDFQLHWCHVKGLPGILQKLGSVGITTRGACGDVARNIVGCPVAGVDREEVLDPGPTIQQLYELFQRREEFFNLPRKYKISVSGCRSQCPQPEIQCVALVGCRKGDHAGFDLRAGGGLSTQAFFGQRLNAFVPPEQAADVVAAITAIWRDTPEYRQKRHHARLKYLVHDWGVVKLRQAVEARLGRALEDADPQYQDPPEQYRDHIGVHAQKQDGYFYVGAPVLVGRITSQQLSRVADLAERYSVPHGSDAARSAALPTESPIRLTVRQNLLLLNVAEADVEKVLAGLADAGLSINAHPVRRSVVTCTGTEFCKLAITETKARSREIVEYLEQRVRLEEPLRLHITGCPNACAQYQIAHIGLMGSKVKVDGQVVDAYDVLVGGQLGRGASFAHAVLRKIPAAECKVRLEQLLQGYKRTRKAGERFNAWCARVGDAELVALLSDRHPSAPTTEDVPTPDVPESEEPVS